MLLPAEVTLLLGAPLFRAELPDLIEVAALVAGRELPATLPALVPLLADLTDFRPEVPLLTEPALREEAPLFLLLRALVPLLTLAGLLAAFDTELLVPALEAVGALAAREALLRGALEAHVGGHVYGSHEDTSPSLAFAYPPSALSQATATWPSASPAPLTTPRSPRERPLPQSVILENTTSPTLNAPARLRSQPSRLS